MLLQDTWNCRVICRRGGSKIRQASSSGGQGHTRSVDGWMLLVVLSARAVLNELVGKRRPEIRRFNLLAVAGEWWRGVSEWQGRGRRGHAARRWRGLATGRARSAERVVSYGPPWAHYLGGNQDRLLGGPLGLPDLRCTVPDGVKHKDFRGEVLG
jgi:hypothetical protein